VPESDQSIFCVVPLSCSFRRQNVDKVSDISEANLGPSRSTADLNVLISYTAKYVTRLAD